MTNNDSPSTIIMTAMRDLATYIANAATDKLRADYPFLPAFLDDDSDYLPAALDLMNDLMTALTDDDSDIACAALLDRIRRDDMMITSDSIRYSELPLDAATDLPIADLD